MEKPYTALADPNPAKLNIILWDLETTNLNADFGYLLCFGWKRLGDPGAKCLSIDSYSQFDKNPTDDRQLVADALDVLRNADAWVTWYGARFDAPYIQTRGILHGYAPLPNVPHIDGWWIARNHLKLHSNRLASVCSFLGLEEKTPLNGPLWIRAAAGHKPSIRYVERHCKQDVLVLEQAYLRLRPYTRTHPNINAISNETDPKVCPICAHGRLQKRGVHVTRTGRRQRFQCMACGGWSSARKQLPPPTANRTRTT